MCALDRRRDRRALLPMWGVRTSEGTGGPEHRRITRDQGVLGVKESGAAKGPVKLGYSEDIKTWHNVCFAELSVGSAPVADRGGGGHGCIRHWPDLTWVC